MSIQEEYRKRTTYATLGYVGKIIQTVPPELRKIIINEHVLVQTPEGTQVQFSQDVNDFMEWLDKGWSLPKGFRGSYEARFNLLAEERRVTKRDLDIHNLLNKWEQYRAEYKGFLTAIQERYNNQIVHISSEIIKQETEKVLRKSMVRSR